MMILEKIYLMFQNIIPLILCPLIMKRKLFFYFSIENKIKICVKTSFQIYGRCRNSLYSNKNLEIKFSAHYWADDTLGD